MDVDIEYLLNYLEDELSSLTEVTIRTVLPCTTQRSPDLPQDYDANSNQLHSERGVRVYAGAQDFFFPSQWVASRQYSEIYKQAAEIKDRFSSR